MVERIQDALNGLEVAPAGTVTGYRVRTGVDYSDDEAVWVYVVVNDEQVEALWPAWDGLRLAIRRVVAEVAGDRVMVYVRMWDEADIKERRVAAP